ncbi:hypothetical protein PG997_012765 [Apiospora hydei]|uniref:Fe2OG dioxygenase domain-containing protein n=1 Tax=Apiospora hydei TaxID=1337664 RepID=A0ABR1V7Q8_9PEZI
MTKRHVLLQGKPESTKQELLEDLRLILEEQNHLFACGCTLPVGRAGKAEEPVDKGEKTEGIETNATNVPALANEPKAQHEPITIRWDVDDNGAADGQVATPCAKLNLPPVSGAGDETSLKRLIQHCQPATFGRGGKDVYDESYRRAGQMAPTAFCTTFDPYSAGIIETVAQVLLPSVYDSVTHRGVRAELYKLNVSDLSLSASPVEHEGGQLKVRHKGQETTFDWSTTHNNKDDPNRHAVAHWAAFYSDCEHEVLEVTRGHRITLTYNLYAVRGFGRLTGAALSPTPLNPTHLPLFETIQRTLSQDPLGGQEGTLGFWCSHAYAYNHKTESPLPDTLKGVDAVFSIFEFFEEWYEDKPDDDADDEEFRKFGGRYGRSRLDTMPKTMPSEWIIGNEFGLQIDKSGMEERTVEDWHYLYSYFGKYSPTPIHWLTKAPTNLDM